MSRRRQRTLAGAVQVTGRGLFSGADVTVEFLPAPEFHGLVFQRTDLPGQPRVPARIDHVADEPRRTVLACGAARVDVTEHVLAALAGLQVDNCLIRLNAPELPNGDGSSRHFVDAFLAAGIVEQRALRPALTIAQQVQAGSAGDGAAISVSPGGGLRIAYRLDYGAAGIPRQTLVLDVTPETFVEQIASARTFVLEAEVAALHAQGFGRHTTPQELLVVRSDGTVIDNRLRFVDEFARHKILDCIGDLALAGADICGDVHAVRSGHRLNHDLVRRMRTAGTISRVA